MKLLDSDEALKALLVLRSVPEFQVFLREIAAFAEERDKMMLFANKKSDMRLLQGQLRMLVELLDAVHKAPATLEAKQKSRGS